MPVTKKRTRMKRTQISLMPEQYETARRLAEERGVSLSQVMRDAFERMEEADRASRRQQLESLRGLIGIVKDADPNSSVDIDRVLYENGEME